MKKVFNLFLALTLVLSVISSFPSWGFGPVSAETAGMVSAATKNDGGYTMDKPYGYIGFKDVDLTGAKSIIITAESTVTKSMDGEWLQVRIDSAKGKIIGYVGLTETTKGDKEFKGSLEATDGVHDLYLVSTIVAEQFERNSKYPYIIKSFTLSSEEYVKPAYVPIPDSALIDHNETTWAMTDDLGRKVADFEEVGPVREGKQAGIFYWTWRTSSDLDRALNMSEFAKEHPEAKHVYDHPAWGSVAGTSHFWNEPLFGFYSSVDYFVARKHAEMFAAAGIDVLFFDCTNNARTFKEGTDVLFRALKDARADGINAPKIVYYMPFGPSNYHNKSAITRAYFNTYKDDNWSDLWFYWEGKPLMIAYTNVLTPVEGDAEDAALMEEIKNFFTFRGGQPGHHNGQVLPNQWGWSENYPQNGYTKNEDGTFEQATVSVAVNDSYVRGDITAMNDPFVTGRSYTALLGHDKSAGSYKYGYFFTEQLNRALEIDPEFLFITGWNEWTGGRLNSWYGIANASQDSYDNDGSRDMEPTKGDMKDNYYALLVDAVRKFKGAEPNPVAGYEKTINLSDVNTWADVTPEYRNFKGTYTRNDRGFSGVTYENYTQRNNVVVSKVSRDYTNLYFYAQTEKAITAPEGDAWMKLYLDVDRNHATGWEGYDFVINCPTPGVISSLNKDGSTNVLGNAQYVVNGNTLSIMVPKAMVGITAGAIVDIEFKWVDNARGDIMNFYVDGKSAPMGRFNYIYTEKAQKSLSADERAALKGVTVVADGSNRAFVNGGKIYTYDPDTRYGAMRINGVMYIPTYFLADALNLKTVWEPDRLILKLRGTDALYTTVGTNQIRKNGVLLTLTNPATVINGIPYIPVSLLSEALGIEVYENGSLTAFGTNINQAAVNALATEF